MDIAKALLEILTSPITVALASAVAFVLGLIARPYVEARSGIFRETTAARRAFQFETLKEAQEVLHRLDPKLLYFDAQEAADLAPTVENERDWRRLEMLTAQVADEPAQKALTDLFEPQEEPDFSMAFDRAVAQVGAALRRL